MGLRIEQVVCPVRHYRGNEKVERMIITIKDQLRVERDIGLTRDQPGLSKILLALTTEIGVD